jgi:hypothetical protein
MLKSLRSTRVPLLLLLILTLGLSLEAVRIAEAWEVVCSSTVRSTSGSGSGADCVEARNDAEANAESNAYVTCYPYGMCTFNFVLQSCTCSGSGCVAKGGATFTCEICRNGPCPF